MATYPAINATSGAWTEVPAAPTDRTAQVLVGRVWVSDDASPSEATAQFIAEGERFFIAANRVYRVKSFAATGVQVRLMDY